MRATAKKIDTTIPEEYKHIVKSAPDRPSELLGYHPTESGAWATDGHRLYIDCPLEELPDKIRETIPTEGNEAIWPVTSSFRRWAKVIAKHDKGCYGGGIIPASNNWLYAREGADFGEVSLACHLSKPPHSNTTISLNPAFLLDAIEYLIGDKAGTIHVTATDKATDPWMFRAGDRTALVMPIGKK